MNGGQRKIMMSGTNFKPMTPRSPTTGPVMQAREVRQWNRCNCDIVSFVITPCIGTDWSGMAFWSLVALRLVTMTYMKAHHR